MGSDPEIEPYRNIVLYDGACNFCNSSVNFIIRHERNHELMFAALQSEFAQELLKKYHGKTSGFDSIILVNKSIIKKSLAAFEICKFLNPPWSYIAVFSVFPVFLTDFFYDIIAKHRYKIFGRSDTCMVPSPEVRSRFLDHSEQDKKSKPLSEE